MTPRTKNIEAAYAFIHFSIPETGFNDVDLVGNVEATSGVNEDILL